MDKTYSDYAASKTVELLGIDSPTGFTARAAEWVKAQFEALGYTASITEKGGVLIELDGENAADALLLEAHTDTLGGMVAEIKSNGRLRLTNLGGLCAANCETENARLYTRGGAVIEGTLQLCNASIHVNGDFADTKRSFDTTELVLDEDVKSAEDTRALGVEVGHGGAGSVPTGVTEAISVDMGCIGDGLQCTERQVSICAKDSGGPYSYEVVGKLIDAAKAEGADYSVDVYPHYGSDVEATLGSGCDIRHGLIGAGVYASHGYERSHLDGVYNTLKVLKGYLKI